MKRQSWRSIVQTALDESGGEASLSEIYSLVSDTIDERPLSKNHRAKVRQILQAHFVRLSSRRWSVEESIAPADIILARIREMFVRANRSLIGMGYDSDTRTVANADVSIDGELRIRSIAHGTTVQKVTLDIESTIEPIEKVQVGDTFPRPWMFGVLRYSAPEGIDSPDSRWRGMAEAIVNAVDASDAKKIANMFATLRVADERIEKKRNKPEQVLIRIYWDPSGTRPTRPKAV